MRNKNVLLVALGVLIGVALGYSMFTPSNNVENVVAVGRQLSTLEWPEYVQDGLVQQMLHHKPKQKKWGNDQAAYYQVKKGGIFVEHATELEKNTDLYYFSDSCTDRIYIIRVERVSGEIVSSVNESHPSLGECRKNTPLT